jgi:hypothetical protein
MCVSNLNVMVAYYDLIERGIHLIWMQRGKRISIKETIADKQVTRHKLKICIVWIKVF